MTTSDHERAVIEAAKADNFIVKLLNEGHEIINRQVWPAASLYYVDGVLMVTNQDTMFFNALYEADVKGWVANATMPAPNTWKLVEIHQLT